MLERVIINVLALFFCGPFFFALLLFMFLLPLSLVTDAKWVVWPVIVLAGLITIAISMAITQEALKRRDRKKRDATDG